MSPFSTVVITSEKGQVLLPVRLSLAASAQRAWGAWQRVGCVCATLRVQRCWRFHLLWETKQEN